MKGIDPNVWLLFLGTVFFAVLLVGVDYIFKGEGQVFQVIAALLAGFSGAFLAIIKARTGAPNPPDNPPPAPPAAPVQPKVE